MAEVDVYALLAERHGYRDSPYYRRILEYLLTPRQARLAAELPAPPEELAQRLDMEVEAVKEELEELFLKGVVFPKVFETREHCRFARNVTQLHDATLSPLSLSPEQEPELFRLWNEFCEAQMDDDLMRERSRHEPPLVRVVPAYRAVLNNPDLLPHEDMREILKAASSVAVVSCTCRMRAMAAGRNCERADDVNCLQFNRGADYAAIRGSGRKLSPDEALALVDKIEGDGLVHTWVNSTSMNYSVMCNCCVDCCIVWTPFVKHGESIGKAWAKSRFQAKADQELCNGCQVCIDRCQFDAIEMEKVPGSKRLKAAIDPEKCWGCGVCVIKCEPEALAMELVRPPEHIPEAGVRSPYV